MKKLLFCLGFLLASVSSFAQDNKFQPVERNRRMPFVAGDSYIKQDNKVIAYYSIEAGEEESKKFIFTLPNGTVVAEGLLKKINAGKLVVTTMADNKKHTVGLKNISAMDVAREVGMFLSDNKYL